METCRELPDHRAIARITKHYWDIEKSVTPVAVLLPWSRGPAKKAEAKAMIELYTLFGSYVGLHRNVRCTTPQPREGTRGGRCHH